MSASSPLVRALVLAAVAAAAACALAAVRPATAATTKAPSWQAVINDYLDNNRIDRPHSCSAVRTAIAHLNGLTKAPGPAAVRSLTAYARRICPAGSFVRIDGGSQRQRQLARKVALRIGGVTIKNVRFRTPDRFLRNQHVRAAEMLVTSSHPATLRSRWEARLFAGVYVALASRYQVPLGGIVAGQGQGPVSRWPHFEIFTSPRAVQVALLRTRLVDAAARAGARVVELRTAAVPARAIALTLRVSDPAAFLKHRAMSVLNILFQSKLPLLGFYVGVDDAGGRLVWATSRLPNEGGVFAIPQLDACSPVKHWGAFGATELPCPAK